MPKVSVILPTYNRAFLIKETIESVLTQTYQDFELIIVDDASNDPTPDVVAGFRSDKIKYFKVEKRGRSGARNFGLKRATGSYISFIDSDDLFLPHKLEKQVELLRNRKEYGMIYTAAYSINDRGARIPSVYNRNDIMRVSPKQGHKRAYFNLKSGDIYYDVSFYVPLTILLPTVMLKREVYEVVGDFDTNLDRFEDIDYWRRVSKRFMILGWDEPTCKIRTHQGNELCRMDTRMILENLNRYYEKVKREDTEKGSSRIRSGMACLYMFYAVGILGQPFWIKSLPFIKKGAFLSPVSAIIYCLDRKFNLGLLIKGNPKDHEKEVDRPLSWNADR